MARESTQHKIDRVMPPRVQITYDVEVGDAIESQGIAFRLRSDGRFYRPTHGAARGEGPKLKVDLNFKRMDDFAPENLARQVGPLGELLELRDRLYDLRGSMQGNDKLEELLRDAVSDKDKLARLRTELGATGGSHE
jgi:type VI secretion system protein ImpB